MKGRVTLDPILISTDWLVRPQIHLHETQRAKSAESVANPLHLDGWPAFRPLLSNVRKVSVSPDVYVIHCPTWQQNIHPRYL
jgi:hypothetical protein